GEMIAWMRWQDHPIPLAVEKEANSGNVIHLYRDKAHRRSPSHFSTAWIILECTKLKLEEMKEKLPPYSSSAPTGRLVSNSCTIRSLSLTRAYLAAMAKAFLIALSPELPWQMMQMPSMPKSGAPPCSL